MKDYNKVYVSGDLGLLLLLIKTGKYPSNKLDWLARKTQLLGYTKEDLMQELCLVLVERGQLHDLTWGQVINAMAVLVGRFRESNSKGKEKKKYKVTKKIKEID